MHRPSPLHLRRTTLRLVVWAMVALVPLQSMAACLLAALGPLHTHRAARTIVVLDDVRRVSSRAALGPEHVATAFGHFHAGLPQRHQHAAADASVVAIDDGAHAAVDGVDASSAGAAGLALLPDHAPLLASSAVDVRAARAGWALQTHDPEPLQRPPRAV